MSMTNRKIRIMTLDQINSHSPYNVNYGFYNVTLHNTKRGFGMKDVYDFWGSILGRWFILIRRDIK